MTLTPAIRRTGSVASARSELLTLSLDTAATASSPTAAPGRATVELINASSPGRATGVRTSNSGVGTRLASWKDASADPS